MNPHLGDSTSREMLEALRGFAPVHSVRGNVDDLDLVPALPGTVCAEIAGNIFVLIHGHLSGATAVQAARMVTGVDAVLSDTVTAPIGQTGGGRLIF